MMQSGRAASMAALALTGCAMDGSDAPPAGAAPVAPIAAPRICNAAPAQSHVGQRADQAAGAAILAASGARTLRWGAPNAAWTMDYRVDRINVRYDDAMIIAEITCG